MAAVPSTDHDQEIREPLFRELNASEVKEGHLETTEIESLCINCEQNGLTRLLLTKIPMFGEIIVSSFSCDHCNYSDSGVEPASRIQDEGVRYQLTVKTLKDLNRQVLKSNTATISIPDLEFEIPPSTQKGTLTTVEGFVEKAIEGLQQSQDARRIVQPDAAMKIDEFIGKLSNLLEVKKSFIFVIDDPCGNSFLESITVPNMDPQLAVDHYKRTLQQDIQCGVVPAETQSESTEEETTGDIQKDEILTFPSNCENCQSPCETRMKPVAIPNFKEVIIMATVCDACGFKSNEVKSGTGINEMGTRIELHLTDISDLSRDILKAETATLSIPELDFEVTSGTLGGRFTTVEGLLDEVTKQLKTSFPYAFGDSAHAQSDHKKLKEFLEKLAKVRDGKTFNVHLILDDPAGNSYIQNVYAPEEDPEMKVIHYKRTAEQDEVLGIDEMKV